MDKSDFMHFVNSVRWHCTILMKTTRLNEDIDRPVREIVTFDQKVRKNKIEFEILLLHRSGEIDGFNELEVLIVHFDELGRVNLEFHVNFCFKINTRHKLEISRQLKMRKTRKTMFVEIEGVNDKPTIQIEIAIEIIVGRPFRVVTIV